MCVDTLTKLNNVVDPIGILVFMRSSHSESGEKFIVI